MGTKCRRAVVQYGVTTMLADAAQLNIRRRLAGRWIAALFLWMCTFGSLMHTDRFPAGHASQHSFASAGTAASTPDTECGACDWNLAVHSSLAAVFRWSLSYSVISSRISFSPGISASRIPLFSSPRAPPALSFC